MPRVTASKLDPQLPRITLDYLANGAPEGRRNYSAFNAAIQMRDARWSIEAASAAILPPRFGGRLERARSQRGD